MAIILPNTRNALGVPNRYSDLAAAGLRYTPPPVYRYDAYDVQGDTATLYEEDIDLADYQYNVDSYDAVVLPVGYTATTGNPGRILIGSDTKLYIRDETSIVPVPGSPSGFSFIARCVLSVGPADPFLAIQSGKLFFCYFAPDLQMRQLGGLGGWESLSFATELYSEIAFFATNNGQFYSVYYNFSSELFEAALLSGTPGWIISGGHGSKEVVGPYGSNYDRIWSFAISPSEQLYSVAQNNVSLQGVPDGWTSVSGYCRGGVSYASASYCYGIRAGELWALSGGQDLPHSRIGTLSDWHKVVFIAPDEAVAIRRIAI